MRHLKRLLTWLTTSTKGRIALTGLVVAAAAGIYLAYWLISPLFIDETVDEAFPLSATAVIPENMTREEAEETMEQAAEVETPVAEAMMEEMESAEVVKSGMFVDGDAFHNGMGAATLYRLPDGSHVLRFEDFRVTNGPDLRVLVSPTPQPGRARRHLRCRLHRARQAQGQCRQPELHPPGRPLARRSKLGDHLLQAVPRRLQRRGAQRELVPSHTTRNRSPIRSAHMRSTSSEVPTMLRRHPALNRIVSGLTRMFPAEIPQNRAASGRIQTILDKSDHLNAPSSVPDRRSDRSPRYSRPARRRHTLPNVKVPRLRIERVKT